MAGVRVADRRRRARRSTRRARPRKVSSPSSPSCSAVDPSASTGLGAEASAAGGAPCNAARGSRRRRRGRRCRRRGPRSCRRRDGRRRRSRPPPALGGRGCRRRPTTPAGRSPTSGSRSARSVRTTVAFCSIDSRSRSASCTSRASRSRISSASWPSPASSGGPSAGTDSSREPRRTRRNARPIASTGTVIQRRIKNVAAASPTIAARSETISTVSTVLRRRPVSAAASRAATSTRTWNRSRSLRNASKSALPKAIEVAAIATHPIGWRRSRVSRRRVPTADATRVIVARSSSKARSRRRRRSPSRDGGRLPTTTVRFEESRVGGDHVPAEAGLLVDEGRRQLRHALTGQHEVVAGLPLPIAGDGDRRRGAGRDREEQHERDEQEDEAAPERHPRHATTRLRPAPVVGGGPRTGVQASIVNRPVRPVMSKTFRVGGVMPRSTISPPARASASARRRTRRGRTSR